MAATQDTTDTLNGDAALGGFARIDHHDIPGYFHAADGVVITVHERDRLLMARRDYDRPYRVIMAQNQRGRYDGVFASRAAAERKAKELVASHLDARSEP